MLEWVLLFVTVVLFLKWTTRVPDNFPPGPPIWPIIGSFPYLKGPVFHKVLKGLSDQYGPVVGMKFGTSFHAVSISGPVVLDALKREEFQGRNKTVRGEQPRPGIAFKDGDHWKQQRRFTLRHLRDFGFGKTSMEGMIFEETQEFFEKQMRGRNQVQVSALFSTPIINMLWAVMAGSRFSYEDKEFNELLELLRESFRDANVSLGFFRANQLCRKLFPKWTGAEDQKILSDRLDAFMKREIEEHRRTRTNVPRDLIDAYLQELEKPNLPESFNNNSLVAVCVDLFTAGAESISNTLSFSILYLVRYPQWQEKLYSEIMEVLGDQNTPSVAEKDRFPLVQAFITEVYRANSVAPIAVPHRCIKDTIFQGHFIPENTFMFLNLWSLLNDKDHWGDPEVFRPERFLTEEGKYRSDEFMQNFGGGPRLCIGEALTRSVLFVFLVVMVREFEFVMPEGEPLPEEEPAPGITQAPRPFVVTPKQRKR